MANSFVRVPPDGAGKRIHTTQHNIDLVDVEVQHMHLSDLNDPTKTLEIDKYGAAEVRYTEGQPTLDPYNNFKVSEENILGVYEFSNNSYDDLFYTKLVDGGTSTTGGTLMIVIVIWAELKRSH